MATRALAAPAPPITGVLARRGLLHRERDLAQALELALGRYLTAPGAAALPRNSARSCGPAVSTSRPPVPTPTPPSVPLPTMRRWLRRR